MTALKSQALLNDSVGAGYVERNWPPALAASGAWPLASLRQSFLNGSLTRLLDPDATLRAKIAELVGRGDFGLASGPQPDGGYGRTWFGEPVPAEEIAFDSGVFLLRKDRAAALRMQPGAGLGPGAGAGPGSRPGTEPGAAPEPGLGARPGAEPGPGRGPGPFPAPSPESWSGSAPETGFGPAPASGLGTTPEPEPGATAGQDSGPESAPPSGVAAARTIRVSGDVPPEVWNRLGRTLLPKLRGGAELTLGVEFSATVEGGRADGLVADLEQILADLGLSDRMEIR